ncbi:hypothetical protein DAKH74_052510 [Maudiozyma humilis]|uniref:Uncharacterized protein n=1 Tax=Maudiozyma humilis TaxID=51915 RepID=A0AAV5S454_MAUHU|nr:hypothetical protein DAKH74_052510 [Kazachstania humilis]
MLTHLIIVPCHSVWKANESENALSKCNLGETTDQWSLAPFQFEGNDHLYFIRHAIGAIAELIHDVDNSVVMFSGSQTKPDRGPMSEAQSYYFLSQKIIQHYIKNHETGDCLPDNFDSQLRADVKEICQYLNYQEDNIKTLFSPQNISTEEFALDSFDNLVYSIGRFYEICDSYPQSISIMGFGFKEVRFLDYHAKAIDFPKSKITCISSGPLPYNYSKEQLETYFSNIDKAENKNALSLFEKDWYGTLSPLTKKKASRNPYNRKANYKIMDILGMTEPITNPEQHYISNIKGKMPWSVNASQ